MARAEPIPPLHAVTDDRVVAGDGFLARAGKVLAAGGGRVALHLRAPGASGRLMHDLAVRLMEMAVASGSLLIVNDRVDVALAADAHGVQLGRRSLSVADARQVMGDRLIGASVHDAAEAREAADASADFLLAGTVYPTASHQDRPAAGVRLIEEVSPLGPPVIAIGGITPERVGDPSLAGAVGIAAIRGIWDAPSPGGAVQRYLDAWESW